MLHLGLKQDQHRLKERSEVLVHRKSALADPLAPLLKDLAVLTEPRL